MLSPGKGIIFTALTMMFGPVIYHVHGCVCVRVHMKEAVWHFLSLNPDDPSSHLCLALSLPSRLCLSVQWDPDVTACFPYQRELVHWEPKQKKKVREVERQSCHSGLSICLFSIGARQGWWEKSVVYQMSLLKIVSVDLYSEAATQRKIILSLS